MAQSGASAGRSGRGAGVLAVAVNVRSVQTPPEMNIRVENAAVSEKIGRFCVELLAASPVEAPGIDGKTVALSLKSYVHRFLDRLDRLYVDGNAGYYGVVAIIYLRRLHKKGCRLGAERLHGLLLCVVLTAVKILEDDHYSDRVHARIGNIPFDALKRHEVAFLVAIGWELQVSREEFAACASECAATGSDPEKRVRHRR